MFESDHYESDDGFETSTKSTAVTTSVGTRRATRTLEDAFTDGVADQLLLSYASNVNTAEEAAIVAVTGSVGHTAYATSPVVSSKGIPCDNSSSYEEGLSPEISLLWLLQRMVSSFSLKYEVNSKCKQLIKKLQYPEKRKSSRKHRRSLKNTEGIFNQKESESGSASGNDKQNETTENVASHNQTESWRKSASENLLDNDDDFDAFPSLFANKRSSIFSGSNVDDLPPCGFECSELRCDGLGSDLISDGGEKLDCLDETSGMPKADSEHNDEPPKQAIVVAQPKESAICISDDYVSPVKRAKLNDITNSKITPQGKVNAFAIMMQSSKTLAAKKMNAASSRKDALRR